MGEIGIASVPPLSEILSDLEAANAEYVVARGAVEDAMERQHEAALRVTDLQAEFEARVEAMKASAGRDTKWGAERPRLAAAVVFGRAA